jgi:hypothetical protein
MTEVGILHSQLSTDIPKSEALQWQALRPVPTIVPADNVGLSSSNTSMIDLGNITTRRLRSQAIRRDRQLGLRQHRLLRIATSMLAPTKSWCVARWRSNNYVKNFATGRLEFRGAGAAAVPLIFPLHGISINHRLETDYDRRFSMFQWWVTNALYPSSENSTIGQSLTHI